MTGLLFDYDGTLHESLRIYAPAMQAVYDRLVDRGLAPPRRLTDRESAPGSVCRRKLRGTASCPDFRRQKSAGP